jgi:hypothetical protein
LVCDAFEIENWSNWIRKNPGFFDCIRILANPATFLFPTKEADMIKGLRTAIYHVSDLAKAKEWYSGVLGQQPYFDQPFYVGYSVGGFELGLVPDGKSTGGWTMQPR